MDVYAVSWSPRRDRDRVLHDVSFSIGPGRVLGIVGPNGAGKTTLLRLLYRFHKPTSGHVALDGENIWQLSARAVAQKIAAVLQEQPTDFALTVREIVALGRTPHRQGFASSNGAYDEQIIHATLDQLDLHGFADRHLGTLSGGERQRVMVARALAQEPKLLILDEPTNHLDIRHQLEILALIRALPLTIVTSLHDLNMAEQVCDDILLLKGGTPIAFGTPASVLCEKTVSDTFEVTAKRECLMPSKTDHLSFHMQSKGSHP